MPMISLAMVGSINESKSWQTCRDPSLFALVYYRLSPVTICLVGDNNKVQAYFEVSYLFRIGNRK